jgi:hypothetical protein
MRVTIDERDLEDLIIRAVDHALERYEARNRQKDPDRPLKKFELAEEWNTSLATIDRYMQNGMPYEKIGKGFPKFYLSKCTAWKDSLAE